LGLIMVKRIISHCDNPQCNHATGKLYLIGFEAFGHWINITRDGERFNIRVDEDDRKVVNGLSFEKAKQVFTIIMNYYARGK